MLAGRADRHLTQVNWATPEPKKPRYSTTSTTRPSIKASWVAAVKRPTGMWPMRLKAMPTVVTSTGGYLAVSRRIYTEAKPQKITETSAMAMPVNSPWVSAPRVMTIAPVRARTRQTSLMGVMRSFSTRAARMVTDTGVRALIRAAMEAPVREMAV